MKFTPDELRAAEVDTQVLDCECVTFVVDKLGLDPVRNCRVYAQRESARQSPGYC